MTDEKTQFALLLGKYKDKYKDYAYVGKLSSIMKSSMGLCFPQL